MPRPTRSRYEGNKRLMKLEDEGILSCYQCMKLEVLMGIRDRMLKPGTLESTVEKTIPLRTKKK